MEWDGACAHEAMRLVGRCDDNLSRASVNLLTVYRELRLATFDYEDLRMRMDVEPCAGARRVVDQIDRELDATMMSTLEQTRSWTQAQGLSFDQHQNVSRHGMTKIACRARIGLPWPQRPLNAAYRAHDAH